MIDEESAWFDGPPGRFVLQPKKSTMSDLR